MGGGVVVNFTKLKPHPRRLRQKKNLILKKRLCLVRVSFVFCFICCELDLLLSPPP